MSERGWLKEILADAKADVNTWPEWLKTSGRERQLPGTVTPPSARDDHRDDESTVRPKQAKLHA